MPSHTAATLAALVERNVEPSTAEDVLAALKRVDGQRITPRLLDHLPGGRDEWRLTSSDVGSELQNRAYQRDAREGMCLILAKSNASVVDAAFVEDANPAYFRLRRERNALRAQALDPAYVPHLEEFATVCNEIERLNAQRASVLQELAGLFRDGEPLSPDRVVLERICGLRED